MRQACKQTERQAGIETSRQIDRQKTDRQEGRHKYSYVGKYTEEDTYG